MGLLEKGLNLVRSSAILEHVSYSGFPRPESWSCIYEEQRSVPFVAMLITGRRRLLSTHPLLSLLRPPEWWNHSTLGSVQCNLNLKQQTFRRPHLRPGYKTMGRRSFGIQSCTDGY